MKSELPHAARSKVWLETSLTGGLIVSRSLAVLGRVKRIVLERHFEIKENTKHGRLNIGPRWHTCCREPDRAAKCQWRELWSFWCHHNPLGSTAGSHLSIAENTVKQSNGKFFNYDMNYECTCANAHFCVEAFYPNSYTQHPLFSILNDFFKVTVWCFTFDSVHIYISISIRKILLKEVLQILHLLLKYTATHVDWDNGKLLNYYYNYKNICLFALYRKWCQEENA